MSQKKLVVAKIDIKNIDKNMYLLALGETLQKHLQNQGVNLRDVQVRGETVTVYGGKYAPVVLLTAKVDGNDIRITYDTYYVRKIDIDKIKRDTNKRYTALATQKALQKLGYNVEVQETPNGEIILVGYGGM